MNEIKPMRLVLAALAGILAAGCGAWFWMQANMDGSRFFGAGAAVVGLIVGMAIRGAAGRPDVRLAVLAGMLTLCGQWGGYYWTTWRIREREALANGFSGVSSISIPLSSIPLLLWLMMVIGIYIACSLALRGQKRTLPGK